jgi:hypothetical protein
MIGGIVAIMVTLDRAIVDDRSLACFFLAVTFLTSSLIMCRSASAGLIHRIHPIYRGEWAFTRFLLWQPENPKEEAVVSIIAGVNLGVGICLTILGLFIWLRPINLL